MRLFGALEAGGTKMVCAIFTTGGELLEQRSFPTRTPEETMPEIIDYFSGKGLGAVGVGSFGPVCVDTMSTAWGTILTTPKLAWQGYPMARVMGDKLRLPIGFDTDVNAAALGEATWGCTKDVKSSLYITIGTGVGTGVLVDGKPLHGLLHSEGGHILMVRHPDDPMAHGICPYHENCLEGLASGPAIAARWGCPAEELADREEVWRLEAYYLGQAIANYVMILSPERVVLGGGVMHQKELLMPLIRNTVRSQLNGYIRAAALDDLDRYIVPASLEDRQGILGGLKLALDAFFTHGGKL